MRPGVIVKVLILSFVVLSFISCSDSPFEPFEGILETDAEGNILGGDSGDWCYDTDQPIVNYYLSTDIAHFALPCTTFGDSAQFTIPLNSTYNRPVLVTVSSSDTSMDITPGSVEMAANSLQNFDACFHLTGDSVHTGIISFRSNTEDSLIQVGFEAGFVHFLIVNNPLTIVYPAEYSLYPAFPNPTSTVAYIGVGMPRSGRVTLKIYDSNEDLIRTLLDSNIEAGTHEVTWDVTDIAPGMYKAYMETADFTCQGDIEVR